MNIEEKFCEIVNTLQGRRPSKNELLCAKLLYEGKVVELPSVEDRRNAIALCACMAAQNGLKVHICACDNFYLMGHDKYIGAILKELNISHALNPPGVGDISFKKQAYQADVLFSSTPVFVVDYLVNSNEKDESKKINPQYDLVIIDDADTELLDNAFTYYILPESPENTTGTFVQRDFFKLYKKLCGVSNIAYFEKAEFKKLYKLDTKIIKPEASGLRRFDLPDVLLSDDMVKFNHIINEIKNIQKVHLPIVVGFLEPEGADVFVPLLKRAGISHNVLSDGLEVEKMLEILASAGKKDALTVVVGKIYSNIKIAIGGDPYILADYELKKLGLSSKSPGWAKKWQSILQKHIKEAQSEREEIVSLGGLYAIGATLYESERADEKFRQLSGTKFEQGYTRFFISLEDKLFQQPNTKRIGDAIRALSPYKEVIVASSLWSGVLRNFINKTRRAIIEVEPEKKAYLVQKGDALVVDSAKAQEPQKEKALPVTVVKIGRNEPCPCGSGKKYKKCCEVKEK